MKHFLLLLITIFALYASTFATHNRAGEITYKQIDDFTYEFTLVTYTYTLSAANETRDSLWMEWGDGTAREQINRVKIDYLPNDIQHNVYVGTHTFPGVGRYEVMMLDPNRNKGVLNINNSVDVVFAIKTTLQISTMLGNNNTPVLLNAPVDKAFKDIPFVHNPGAYDSDGDSLAYRLTTCLGENGAPIPDYVLPNYSKSLTVNPETGDLVWDSPTKTGTYNIAMVVEEWRNGIKIGEIVRDMQIEVYDTDVKPPVIEEIEDICVLAGQNVAFDISATVEQNSPVTISANGGPLSVDSSPAVFYGGHEYKTVTGYFEWQTTCAHIRKYPYQLVVKAETPAGLIDGPGTKPREIRLVSYRNVNIRVVAPPPLDVQAKPATRSVTLKWKAGDCPGVEKYKIYRRTGPGDYEAPECVTGLPDEAGYTLVDEIAAYEYLDNNHGSGLGMGMVYCYRIVAVYPDGAESYPSEEVCAELKRGLVVITHADVNVTDTETGEVYLKWLTPNDFNTDLYPGPYRYMIFHSFDLWGGKMKADPIAVLDGLEHTSFTDVANTHDTPITYVIGFFNMKGTERQEIGPSDAAASVFLELRPSGGQLQLLISQNTPWENDSFAIYRKAPLSETFEFVDFTKETTYADAGLINGQEYCYYVESYGHYLAADIERPLINRSQIACGIPEDVEPPCDTQLGIRAVCDSMYIRLSWKNPNELCDAGAVKYNVYFRTTTNTDWTLLKTTTNLNDTVYIHEQSGWPKGCYRVTALDDYGNESIGIEHCVDNCTDYTLPNVFTPNADGANDKYVPVRNFGVDKVDMKIYNRWGEMVFKTDDPAINWDGAIMGTKNIVSEGVYYYVCDVYEQRVSGEEVRTITGFIHIFVAGSIITD